MCSKSNCHSRSLEPILIIRVYRLPGTKALGGSFKLVTLAPRTVREMTHLRKETQKEAQLMLTTGWTRLAVSRGQQTWYHYGSIATFC